MSIHLHIDRLVLDGVSVLPHERPVLQAAVEEELTRLLAADGLPSTLMSDGAVPSVPASAIQLKCESGPTRLGQQIARAVYGGMRR